MLLPPQEELVGRFKLRLSANPLAFYFTMLLFVSVSHSTTSPFYVFFILLTPNFRDHFQKLSKTLYCTCNGRVTLSIFCHFLISYTQKKQIQQLLKEMFTYHFCESMFQFAKEKNVTKKGKKYYDHKTLEEPPLPIHICSIRVVDVAH